MAEPRVLFVTTSYPSSPVDRAGPFIHCLARALVREGVPVSVLAPAHGTSRGRSSMEGVAIHRYSFLPARRQNLAMGFGGIPAAVGKSPLRLLQLPLMLATAAALAVRAAASHDILHAHWLPNLLPLAPAALLRNRPRVVTLWGTDVAWYESSSKLRPAFRALLRGADGVAAINDHMVDLFADKLGPKGEMRLIPSGVDTDLFRPRDKSAQRTRFAIDERAFAIAFVGSLIPRKGADLAIEAIAAVPAKGSAPQLLLVGEGPERTRLEQLAVERGVEKRVRFLGERSIAEVGEILSACDAFVLPSHYEGRPNVVLEAQASGLAVIGSDIPGCRDLIEEGESGLLFPAGDAAALAEKFTSLAEDAALCRRLGGNAARAIRDGGLTWDACARRYAELYRDLLAARVRNRVPLPSREAR